MEGALQVHIEHGVEERGLHVLERLVPEDSGVVDDDVHLAERVDRRLHDGLAAFRGGHGVGVGHGLTAGRRDLVDHVLGRPRHRPRAIDGPPEVVDDDACASLCKDHRVLAAEAAAGTGDDREVAVESEFSS